MNSTRGRMPVWVWGVIVLCCAIEALVVLGPQPPIGNLRALVMVWGGFWPVLLDGQSVGVFPGQPIAMFATYGFLHGGIAHLGMNMLSLLALAPELGRMIGSGRMAVVYAVTQVAAAAVYAVMSPPSGPMVGASGAIFGLAGALVAVAFVRSRKRGLPMGPLARSVAVLIGLNVALTLAMPAIAWQAHLGGALAGVILGLMMAQGRPRTQARLR